MSQQIDTRYGITVGDVIFGIPDKGTLQNAPEWIIEISGGITKSKISSFETFVQLLDFYFEYTRETNGKPGGEMSAASGIAHSAVSVLIPVGTCSSTIRQVLNEGKSLDSITIHRFSSSSNLKKPSQTLIYKKCLITKASQKGDFLAFSFRFVEVKEVNVETSDENGAQAGNHVYEINYGNLKV